MGEENKNWFARHRTAVLGIAIAVLILNLVVLVAVPTQTPVELSQTVTEYALADEAFAQAHTLTLTGRDADKKHAPQEPVSWDTDCLRY